MGKSKNRRKKPRKDGKRHSRRQSIQPVDGRVEDLLRSLADQLGTLPLGPCFASDGWRSEGELTSVCITRHLPSGKLAAVVFLVDLACLGVKDVVAKKVPEAMLPSFFASFPNALEPCEPALAVKIVTTAEAYAAELELSQAPAYELARLIFGDIDPGDADEEIRTGKNGKPCFMAGPQDDVDAIVAHLTEKLGPNNFDFIAPM